MHYHYFRPRIRKILNQQIHRKRRFKKKKKKIPNNYPNPKTFWGKKKKKLQNRIERERDGTRCLLTSFYRGREREPLSADVSVQSFERWWWRWVFGCIKGREGKRYFCETLAVSPRHVRVLSGSHFSSFYLFIISSFFIFSRSNLLLTT
jgi:hypothetical protein